MRLRRYTVTFKTKQYERIYNVNLKKTVFAESEKEARQIVKDLYDAMTILTVTEHRLIQDDE